MRALVLLAAMLAAAPAAAQDYLALTQARDADAFAAEMAARARDVAVANERFAQEARVRTEQALGDLAPVRAPLPAPGIRSPKIHTPPSLELFVPPPVDPS